MRKILATIRVRDGWKDDHVIDEIEKFLRDRFSGNLQVHDKWSEAGNPY